jgi:hypothetical protein
MEGNTMKTKTCFELPETAFPIRLLQNGIDSFTVEYGKQVHSGLSYGAACTELGQAIMHALSCDGKVDNRLRGER